MTSAPPVRLAAPAVLAGCLSVPVVLLGSGPSYAVRTTTALLAVVLLLRPRGRDAALVRSRRLVALALGAGVASGLTALGCLLVTGRAARLGGPADWLYLSYAPAALLALLSMTRQRRAGDVARALADGAVAACALAILVVGLLEDGHALASRGAVAQVAALIYPLSAVFVLSVLLSVLPRASDGLRPFLPRAAAGLALVAVSDVAYSVAATHGWYSPSAWPAALNQCALVVLALAAATPAGPPRPSSEPRSPALRALAPYLPLLACAAGGLALWLRGRGLSPAQLLPLSLLAVALVARHLLATREQGRSLAALREREAQAREAARRDALTGLTNRQGLSDALTDGARAAVRRRPRAARPRRLQGRQRPARARHRRRGPAPGGRAPAPRGAGRRGRRPARGRRVRGVRPRLPRRTRAR